MRSGIKTTVMVAAAVFASIALSACTVDGPNGSDPSASAGRCDPGPGCDVEVVSEGRTYRLECRPVPEALVDVDLPQEGNRPIKAIAGVSSTQGVAAIWRDPQGCGQWVLALAEGLSAPTATSIRDEIARGVERFGVTASPVPKDAGTG